jgi:hypothetical protein
MAQTIKQVTIEYSDGTSTVITGSSSGSSTSPSFSTPKYTQVTKKSQLSADVKYYEYDSNKSDPYVYIGKFKNFSGFKTPNGFAETGSPAVLYFKTDEDPINTFKKIFNSNYTNFDEVSDEDIIAFNLYTKDGTGGGRKRKSHSRRAAKSYQKQGRRKYGRKSRR